MQLIKDAWAGLDAKGRTVVAALVVLAIIVLALNGVDLAPLWVWLGAG